MSDVSDEKTDHSFSGFLIESDRPASPCGLIAKSMFNGKKQKNFTKNDWFFS